MQVSNNNYGISKAPSFGAIKSVKCEGLYKKFPELCRELVDAFQKNEKAMQFCKKYDVNVVFYAVQDGIYSVESSLHIFYDNIAKSKFVKFLNSLSNSKDNVRITAFGNEFDLNDSMRASTTNLKTMMLPARDTVGKPGCGILDSHIDLAEEDIDSLFQKKHSKKLMNETKKAMKENSKSKMAEEKAKLNESLKNLIDRTK